MRNTFRALAIAGGILLAGAASAAGPGDRIKTACPAGATTSHSCRAVYYWAGDGKRHAFPNARIYASWFADFNGVQTVTAEQLAALGLGKNVTYRPGYRLIKTPTLNDVYAVDTDGVLRPIASEFAAKAVFGTNWNKNIDDLPDSFFTDYRVGAVINFTTDYDTTGRLAATPDIDAALGSSYAYKKVVTSRGTFDAYVVSLDRAKYKMKTLTASDADCSSGCPVKSLSDFASELQAPIGINGTYFCPPDYADCASKINSFLWPVYDSPSQVLHNAGSVVHHKGPLLASAVDGKMAYYRSAASFGSTGQFANVMGSTLDAAIANYPALIDRGTVVVDSEPMLDDGQRNNKATRGGIGISNDKIYLIVAKNATVPDLAEIMKVLGATDAMNLDGGGSSALMYGGTYKVGPGRTLPNAIVFVRR